MSTASSHYKQKLEVLRYIISLCFFMHPPFVIGSWRRVRIHLAVTAGLTSAPLQHIKGLVNQTTQNLVVHVTLLRSAALFGCLSWRALSVGHHLPNTRALGGLKTLAVT
jgi:hypothetical protein